MTSTGTVMIYWMSRPIAASNLAQRGLLLLGGHAARWSCCSVGHAGWSCCSVACGAGGGGSAPAAAPDAALMPAPCSRSFSVRPSASPSSSPAPFSLSSSIIRVGVCRPPRPARQYRLDGDAGLAHPVRPRGCFSASLAFFFLIALALGGHAGLVFSLNPTHPT